MSNRASFWGLAVCAAFSCVALACSRPSAGADQLRARSAFDLNCPSEAIQVQPLDERTVGVIGCGHRVTYVESCNAPKYYANAQCTWVMNSDAWQVPGAPATEYAAHSLQPIKPQLQPVPPTEGASDPTLPPAAEAPSSPEPNYRVRPVRGPTQPTRYDSQPRGRPAELPYAKGDAIPPGYRLEEYHSKGLIIGGAVSFGALYAISVAVAVEQQFSAGYEWLAVPLIGPFAWLGTHRSPTCSGTDAAISSCRDTENTKKSALVLEGLGQAAGAALLVTGLAVTHRHLVLAGGRELKLTPFVSGTSGGLSFFGSL